MTALLALVLAAASARPQPLRADDFKRPLTPESLRAMDAALTPDDAAAKWKISAKNASKLSRAYPDAFWADMKQVKELLPGGIGNVLGDIHTGNFEFIKVGAGHTVYGYSDYANSGVGHVSVDALRGFVNLRLQGASDRDVRSAIDRYVDGLDDPVAAGKLPKQFDAPDWKALREHKLAKLTDGDRFADKEKLGLTKVPAKIRAQIEALAEPGGPLASYRIHDMAEFGRFQGSTGGYSRYWLLAEHDGKPALLELGEDIRPGVSYLEGTRGQPKGEARLGDLQKAFWGVASGDDYFNVKLDGKDFTARDRFRMSGPNFEKLSGSEQRKFFGFQAEVAARVHAPAWEGVDRDALRDWLWSSSKTVANRWETAAKAAKEERDER